MLATDFLSAPESGGAWSPALVAWGLAWVLAGGVVALCVCGRRGRSGRLLGAGDGLAEASGGLSGMPPTPRTLIRGWVKRQQATDATATMEFALCFPILLFFALLTLQVGLMVAAHAVMQRSASAAVRALVVQLPATLPGEDRNIWGPGKHEKVFDAAWYATVPISGREADAHPSEGMSTAVDPATFADAVDAFMQGTRGRSPRWVNNFVAARAQYAINHTRIRVEVVNAAGGVATLSEGSSVQAHQALAVRVEHDLNLSVPFVRPLFASASHTTNDGPGAYTTVWVRALMVNQGIDTAPPPPPPAEMLGPGEAPGLDLGF